MTINLYRRFREQSMEYGVPFWKLPDVILLFMAGVNIITMVITYWWAADLADDPREAVLVVSAEAVIIFIIGNIMAESSKEIIDNNKLKKEMIHIISHQMRTPTTTIKWNVELLKRKFSKKISKDDQKYLNRIYEENENIREMIEEMLTVSRLETKKEGQKPMRFMAEEVIFEVIDALRGYAEIKEVMVIFDKYDKVEVLGKKELFKAIAINLVENAIRYSRKKSKVEISLKAFAASLVLTVEDKGIGIARGDYRMMFSKFFRGEAAKTFHTEGTGLGLYVVKKSVEELGGEITFKSKVGKGTSFKVVLPLGF